MVASTDASESGRKIYLSYGITSSGERQTRELTETDTSEASDQMLLVFPFDGIGCARTGWAALKLGCAAHIAIEQDKNCCRVTKAQWPGVEEVADIVNVDLGMVQDWRRRHGRVNKVLCMGGSPCQDFSSLNAERKNLEGERGLLLHEFVRVISLVRAVFEDCSVHWCLENVRSMDTCARDNISSLLGVQPLMMCSSLVSWQTRQRYFWASWDLQGIAPLVLIQKEGYAEIMGDPVRASCESWLDEGASWSGEADGRAMRTLVRWTPRRSVPSRPHGIESCSGEAIDRWRASRYAQAPFFFESWELVKDKSGALRVPSITERERLMGLVANYTDAAVKSSIASSDKAKAFEVRASVLGNGMHSRVVSFLLSHLASKWGLRDGPLSLQDMAAWDAPVQDQASPGDLELRLVNELMRRADARGSDVKLTTGEMMKPSRISRLAVQSGWWRWKTAFGFAWKHDGGHINLLEMLAALSELKRRTRQLAGIGSRYLHLLDSQVALGVLTKKRSSSRILMKVCRKFSALELASSCKPFFSFVRSADNPADEPSRRFCVKKTSHGTKDSR